MEAQREVGKTCRCLFPVLLCSFLPSALLKYREKRQGGGAERDRQERNQRGGRSVRWREEDVVRKIESGEGGLYKPAVWRTPAPGQCMAVLNSVLFVYQLTVKALQVCPESGLGGPECCLRISLLPLRLNIDQVGPHCTRSTCALPLQKHRPQ